MRFPFLGALAGALLGLAALPSASAAVCPGSPYTMGNAKTSDDLNTLLASWNLTACVGRIAFSSVVPKTYQLTETFWPGDGSDITWDGSTSAGVTIVAPYKARIMMSTTSLVTGASVLVKGLTFQGNSKVEGYQPVGGCFAMRGFLFTGVDSVFQACDARDDGGAINVNANLLTTPPAPPSRLSLTGCSFLNVISGYGAVSTFKTPMDVTNCIFENCVSTDIGGAIVVGGNPNGDLYVKNTTFSGCRALNGRGGAVWALSSPAPCIFDECTFTNNSASGLGGAIYVESLGTDLIILNSRFSANSDSTGVNDINDRGTFTCINSCPAVTVPVNQCLSCAPTPAPTPVPPLPNMAAAGWTRPRAKVAPSKTFTYTATLVNSRKATGGKTAFADVIFVMPIPAGVTVLSSFSHPKLATAATIDTAAGFISWDMGSLKPGRKVKLTFKLTAPSSCSTPAPLGLQGQFAYTDAVGPQTAEAFLKDNLYVWTKGCTAIPKESSER